MREVKPTQEPVPSSNIKDLFFNSGLLDIWATSLEHKYIDRFGNCHLTAAGMEWIFNELVTKFKIESEQALLAAGYASAGTFQEGAEVVSRNGTVLWKLPDGDGEHYRWDGELPKQVPAGSTPQSTGGIGKGAWVSVGDASLRSDIKTNLGASLIGTSSGLTVQQIIDRGTIYIDDLITSRNGDVDASAPINALLEQIRSMTDRRWVAKIVGTRGARYRFDSMIDIQNVSCIEFDFGLATIVDNVQGFLPTGRANHTFLSYDNKDVKIKNIIYEVTPTRSNSYDNNGISTVVFWAGSQYHGWEPVPEIAETVGTVVENFYAYNSQLKGGMVATAVGETIGFKLKNFNIIGGIWKFGVNLEWGAAPADPSVDDSDNNGRHPHNAIIESFSGSNLKYTEAFLRVASSYNVIFKNCTGTDVTGFIYVYSGDRGIARCRSSYKFENCKGRVTRSLGKATNLVTILILDRVNNEIQPTYTQKEALIEFDNCELSGNQLGSSACLRFIGNAGLTSFNNCVFENAVYGANVENNDSVTYPMFYPALFTNCIFKNNQVHFKVGRIAGVKFDHVKFLDQSDTTLEPIQIGNASNFTEFESCYFRGKVTESYINIDRAVDCKFYKNVFVKSGIDGAMIKSNMLTYGLHNRSDTQILSLLLSDKRMIGEDSTSVKSIDSLAGEIIDYECVTTCTSSNSGKIISQINNGKIGDVIEFRGVAVASSVKFLNAKSGVSLQARIVLKSQTDLTVNGNAWSIRFKNLGNGWYEM
ncbi:hypothetical protein [Providencia rettgeri]|uniref:tail fiber/spike domain-containing protein n=1 Tax=Providencia rettgeri TaxID=587 RepID=UPI0039F62003